MISEDEDDDVTVFLLFFFFLLFVCLGVCLGQVITRILIPMCGHLQDSLETIYYFLLKWSNLFYCKQLFVKIIIVPARLLTNNTMQSTGPAVFNPSNRPVVYGKSCKSNILHYT